MNIQQTIEIAGGTTIGATHRKKAINNQDSYKALLRDDLFVGVVCDGASAGSDILKRSEVGSALLSEFVTSSIAQLKTSIPEPSFFELLFEDVCDKITRHLDITGAGAGYVEKYLQATIVGCIAYAGRVYIFSCGDGIYFLNGKQYTLLPQDENTPVYLAHRFMPTIFSAEILEKELKFHLHQAIGIDEVESLLIGTDGVQELIEAKDKMILIRDEPVGDISQWWTKDLYFQNPLAITNWLRMINHPQGGSGYADAENGYFHDDVTFISLRKKKEA